MWNSEKLLYLNYETCFRNNKLSTCNIVRKRHTLENELLLHKTKRLQLSVPRDLAFERCRRVATGKQRNCQKDVSLLDTEPPQAAKTSKPVLVQDWRISVTRCDTAELLQHYLNATQTVVFHYLKHQCQMSLMFDQHHSVSFTAQAFDSYHYLLDTKTISLN